MPDTKLSAIVLRQVGGLTETRKLYAAILKNCLWCNSRSAKAAGFWGLLKRIWGTKGEISGQLMLETRGVPVWARRGTGPQIATVCVLYLILDNKMQ